MHRRSISAVCCSLGFVLNAIAYYPGFITPDGIDQYEQAVTGIYHDWHPPAMAFAWSFLNSIYQGSALMLFYQLACLWLSAFLLINTYKKRVTDVAFSLFLFLPFVQNFAGCIVKDTQMALSWLLAVSIIIYCLKSNGKLLWWQNFAVVLLLLYGTWVRTNAFTGALPLYFLWAWAVANGRKKMLAANFTAVCTASILGMWLFSGVFFKVKPLFPENKLYLHDLTNIYVATGENVYPDILYTNPDFDTAYLRYKHHPATFDNIWWNNDSKTVLPDTNAVVTRQVRNAWGNAIMKHPKVYLAYRFEGFLYFLRIKDRSEEFYYYFPWIHENRFGLKKEWNALTDFFMYPVKWQEHMPYMRPYFWFILNVLMLLPIMLIKRRNRMFYSTLVLSGLLYILPQFFIFQVDTDFRYFYWNCIACTTAFIVLMYCLLTKN